MPNITLHVAEPDAVTLRYVEAKIKPEQVGSAVPGWEPQTVTPDPGCVFSRVEIAGMPEPTEEQDITENGEYHVERIGVVNVDVPQGVFPSGTREITENNVTVDVENYKNAHVEINTDPEIGVVFGDFLPNGLPQTVRTVGMEVIPKWMFYRDTYDRTYLLSNIRLVVFNEGVTRVSESCCRGMISLEKVIFPSTLTTIDFYAFFEDTKVAEYDFSACESIPTLSMPNTFKHASGCVMKIKDTLLAEWQAAAGWSALTDVVWQGV